MNFLLREEEKQPSKKDQILLLTPYVVVVFGKKTFQERRCVVKILFGIFESFSCQKPSSFIICGE